MAQLIARQSETGYAGRPAALDSAKMFEYLLHSPNFRKRSSDLLLVNTAKSFRWYTVDDQVAGGNSQSFVKFQKPDHIKFHGNIRAKSGGFCEAKSISAPVDVS